MKKIQFIIIILLIFGACKDAYDPGIVSPQTGYLVVEGFIMNGNTPTVIQLSRTTRLDTSRVKPEKSAKVIVEGDNNEAYTLNETSSGLYQIASLALKENAKYRISITTLNGQKYVSDFASVNRTPTIDSITWQRKNDGLQLFVNSMGDDTQKFYLWKFDETWEIQSAYLSSLTYERDKFNQPVRAVYKFDNKGFDMSIFRCWKNNKSSNILIGTTEKLSSNKVFLPIQFIEPQSEKLGILYSMELKQYTLSANAYNFYSRIKKNTEAVGSIFDAQPSDAKGNVKSVDNPSEIVIGYVEISTEAKKRIFIYRNDVKGWGYFFQCQLSVVPNIEDSVKYLGLAPTEPAEFNRDGSIKTFGASGYNCVDCTLRGSNVKPAFWPN